MGAEAKANQRKQQEELTGSLAQSLILVLRATRSEVVALTVAISFKSSDSEVAMHTATLAVDADSAASHAATLAAAITAKADEQQEKQEVPS